MSLMNIYDIYNFSSINYINILKKKSFRVKTNVAHIKRKRYNKQSQFILFNLRRIFIFEIIFIVEQFIYHDEYC